MRAASLPLKLFVATLATSASATRLPGPFSNRNMRIRPSFKNLATLWATCSLGGLIFTWRAYRAANAPESPLDAVIVPGGGLDERGEPSARFRVGATSVVVRLVRAMTPDPRPAGALFRGLANEATSPRGAHRKDLPPHALGRAGPLTHTG